MATLASEIVNRVVSPFHYHDSIDHLQASATTTAATITLGTDYRVGEGTVIEVDSELMLCTSFDTSARIATVTRGILGTTPASHSNGTLAIANPRLPRFQVLDYINDAMSDMYPRLFAVGRQDITYGSSSIGYELDADADEILSVAAKVDSGASLWEYLYDWEKIDNLPTASFSSGQAIMIRNALPSQAVISVVYTQPFTPATDESDDLEADCGLQTYMTDLPYYFAMSRVMSNLEVDRSQIAAAQNHQRAQDVPGFLALRTGEWYMARYMDGLITARARQSRESRRVVAGSYGG